MATAAPTILIFTQSIVIIFAGLIVIRVAPRATGSVSRGRPIDILAVRLMTFCTGKVAAVILRFIRQCSVTVICGSPGIRNVAGIALLRRAEVTRVRAHCNDTVVAARTRTEHLCMIDSEYGRKHIGGVAVFADIRRLRVARILADRIRPVMAAETVTRDIYVVEIRR